MSLGAEKQRRAALRRREERARLAGLAREWCDDERAAVAIVPTNDGRTSQLPKRRRERFVAHLRELVDTVGDRAAGGDARRRPERTAPETSADPILSQACATCRGSCCRTGGDNAFLDTSDIERFWSSRPRASRASIVRAYLAALPERSYAGSCVFHARSGCALPREMRAHLCNVFHCDGLRELRRELQPDASRPAFVVATGNRELVRATKVGADGVPRRVRRPRPA